MPTDDINNLNFELKLITFLPIINLYANPLFSVIDQPNKNKQNCSFNT